MSSQFSGSITYHKDDDISPMKTISWKNGNITKYNETFDVIDKIPISINLELAAESVLIQ